MKYFALAYQTHSFSAAAERVPMSVQGLAKAIRSLESELGVTLFITDKNGARIPTLYADELYQFSRTWDSGYQILQESILRIRAHEKHEIRLGTSLGIIGLFGPDFLNTFHQEHPDILVTYSETNDAICDEALLRGSYDLALILSPYPKDFITTELYSEPVYFWVRADNPLSAKKSLTLDDLSGCSIAIPGRGFKCYESIITACIARGAEPKEVIASSEIFWLYEFALSGRGIGFTLPHLANLPFFSKEDSIVSIPLEDVSWHFGISYLPSHSLSKPEQLFYDHCIAYSKKLPHP
ncbi:MAG: LysR family transcriptional regulator [Actinobacteria bacterium]|nr:LysR family transcriptional regulator [Actinomycetota bacterium]